MEKDTSVPGVHVKDVRVLVDEGGPTSSLQKLRFSTKTSNGEPSEETQIQVPREVYVSVFLVV